MTEILNAEIIAIAAARIALAELLLDFFQRRCGDNERCRYDLANEMLWQLDHPLDTPTRNIAPKRKRKR